MDIDKLMVALALADECTLIDERWVSSEHTDGGEFGGSGKSPVGFEGADGDEAPPSSSEFGASGRRTSVSPEMSIGSSDSGNCSSMAAVVSIAFSWQCSEVSCGSSTDRDTCCVMLSAVVLVCSPEPSWELHAFVFCAFALDKARGVDTGAWAAIGRFSSGTDCVSEPRMDDEFVCELVPLVGAVCEDSVRAEFEVRIYGNSEWTGDVEPAITESLLVTDSPYASWRAEDGLGGSMRGSMRLIENDGDGGSMPMLDSDAVCLWWAWKACCWSRLLPPRCRVGGETVRNDDWEFNRSIFGGE